MYDGIWTDSNMYLKLYKIDYQTGKKNISLKALSQKQIKGLVRN